ncbi:MULTISPECIES: hypothetical protein [unclassified Pseudomonas]|nr:MULTISPECIES: hypothetical protein [unclassified Pseudomonas]NWC93369.1 hypothetical protein [Pseudomonas sp. IPO3779]NWD18662.1 hypothetical protein [Pseudomonas sp. IPO3778]
MPRSLWTRFKLQIAVILTGSLLLGGCASTGSSMVETNKTDPRLTQGSDAQFFSKSGYQACAVGAGIGILSCALSNSSNKAVCAVAAGITACGVAMGANYYLDQRRSEYSNTGQRLTKMNNDVQQDTQNVIARTATAQQVINDDQTRIAQIKQAMASGKINKAKAQTDIAEIDNNIAIMRKDLANMRNKASEYAKVAQQERQDGAGPEIKQVDASIAKMNEKVAALQKEVDGLYTQRSAITLG